MAEPTFFASVLASAAGANKVHLSLHNAGASTIRVHRVLVGANPQAAVTGLVIPLKVARFVAAAPATGSALSPLPTGSTLGVVDVLPGTITARTAPTAPGGIQIPFGVGAISGEETASLGQQVLYQHQITGTKAVELTNGQGLVVQQAALASAGAVDVVVIFTVA